MSKDRTKLIQPYLPDLLLKPKVSGGVTEMPHVIEGSLLFADLSGFTSMSEKLASMGRMGGERLAEIMNSCFNSLLGRVFTLRGDVIKFGGDAFLAYFDGEDCVHRASLCAANLIRWISENGHIQTPVGEFSLGIHTGISYGKIYNLSIGEKRHEHLFCGKTVENCYAAADAAQLGELALTSDAAERLTNLSATISSEGYHICDRFDGLPAIESSPREIPAGAAEDYLESFIITGLEPQLHFNDGVIEGEHRVLTSLFISVNSLRKNLESDLEKSIAPINRYFTAVNDVIERYGGAFARLDSSGSSEKMLVFFGAPVSFGRDANNCLQAVLEIQEVLKKVNADFIHPISHRYGINTGLCFVGDVGGESRREYTAMGDAINLAARLMGKAAYGDVLVGEDTLKICGDDFITEKGELVEIKGKKDLIPLYSLVGVKEKVTGNDIIIGREQELQTSQSFIDRIAGKEPAVMMISGEPGAGKSLLCSRIRQMATKAGLQYIEGACFKHSEKTPYGPLKAILLGVYNLNSRSNQKQRRAALTEAMKTIDEAEWLPMIAPLMDFNPPVPPHLKNLPEDVKKDKIKDLIVKLICQANQTRPALIVVEDVQWVDDTSFSIIKTLLNCDQAPGIMFISRPGAIFDELKKHPKLTSLELGGLTTADSRRLFLTVLGDITPDEHIIEQVIEKSGGNPFYLEEMASAFRELGPEQFEVDENIPSGIESVITARIDNLGEMIKRTVRTASVIGRVFAYNVLKDIFPDKKRADKIRNYLKELAHLDLTPMERAQPVLEYVFKHILTQEVAYNGLSFSARQALHLKTAEYYASRKRCVKREPEIPSRHYLLAGEPGKALPFLFMAGEKAVAEFANTEANGYYTKVIEIAEQLNDSEYLLKALENRGELAKHTGDYKSAESDYLRLKELSASDHKLLARALRRLSEIYRFTAEYDKAEMAIGDLEGLLSGDIANQAYCFNGRGEITRRSGKLQECQSFLLKALELCENHQVSDRLKAVVYNNLGVCHWGMGKLKESAEYYKSALKLYRQLKDLSGQSKVTNNLGIISDEMGKLDQAAKSYEKAERIFKRIGATRMQAFACANLGTNLLTRGFLGQARERILQARKIFERIGDHHSLAYAVGDLGFLYFRIGDYDSAEKYLNEALEKARSLKDDEFILESEMRLVWLNQAQGKLIPGKIKGFIENAGQIGSAELEIKAKIAEGIMCLQQGDYQNAGIIIADVKKANELGDFPELTIELNRLEIILARINQSTDSALKTLNATVKKALAGDLALMAIDLAIMADALELSVKLSPQLTKKINMLYERVRGDINENEFSIFAASCKRKAEILKSQYCLNRNPKTSISRINTSSI